MKKTDVLYVFGITVLIILAYLFMPKLVYKILYEDHVKKTVIEMVNPNTLKEDKK